VLNEYKAREEIETELQIEPGLDATAVEVAVQDAVVTVTGHVVTLTGEVDWEFQKALIERTVRRQSDVIGVANQIIVRHPTVGRAIQEKLMCAYRKIAEAETAGAKAAVDPGLRTLSCKAKTARARRRSAGAGSIHRLTRFADQFAVG
jgi:osmotically-inducible protein OsmY